MQLMPGWLQRLAQISALKEQPPAVALPRSPAFYRDKLTFVDTVEAAQAILSLARERPLSHVGIDTEYRFSRPGLTVSTKQRVHDVRSVQPLLLSVTLAEPREEQLHLYSFVVDLRVPAVVEAIRPLFRLPLCFVGHNLKVEWFCLWQLGIEPPRQCWDSFIAEKARYLGLDHKSYQKKPGSTVPEDIQAKHAAQDAELYRMDLVTCCRRYGIHYRLASDKSRLQQSFLEHPPDQPFSRTQIDYAAEDALAAASLYTAQVLATTQQGILQHLVEIEMPWVTTNARMIWTGMRVDSARGASAQVAANTQAVRLTARLQDMGLANVNSHPQLLRFFAELGLLEHFRRNRGYSFDKETIKSHQDLHPAIQLIRDLRKAEEWRNLPVLNPGFVGADGRIHPDFKQLGAASGRQTCNHPNVLALSRVQRNLIVPASGYGIGEVDLSQIEPGIAGAVYQDEDLIQLFNTGDVYSAMAQRFYAGELDDQVRQMSTRAFKEAYGDLRKPMKTCTLGLIYGLSAHGLAAQLKISEQEAARLLTQFKALFPALAAHQQSNIAAGQLLGYASTTTGLRRYRGRTGRLLSTERNWMVNHPVQGTAAALFKAAGNELDRLLQPLDARLILPLHDSYVFEAPLDKLEQVGSLVGETLCHVVQRYFPALQPRVDINTKRPECWNKDGDDAALTSWIRNSGVPLEGNSDLALGISPSRSEAE